MRARAGARNTNWESGTGTGTHTGTKEGLFGEFLDEVGEESDPHTKFAEFGVFLVGVV